ncbi:MAG TPA: hypothetical protein VFT30_09775 [Nitrospira sp.]|jgi:hypothetical protein|nr:hypothetical protein [Nitrospira sp.]
MATTTQYWTDENALLYQAFGTTVDWTWDYGDGTFFWSFCVRPLRRQADVFVTVERVTAVEDIRTNPSAGRGGNQATILTVTVDTTSRDLRGKFTDLRFTAIKVSTP